VKAAGIWCVDLGGLFTKAAAGDGGRAGAVPIAGGLPDRPYLLSSAVIPDDAALRPERVVTRPRDDLGAGPTADGACLVAGPEGLVLRPAPEVCAVLLRRAHDALRVRHGSAPDRFVLTHPGRWRPGSPRLNALLRAARLAGLPPVDLLAVPIAMLPATAPGGVHLICDLGATGEIAVVRRGAAGRDEVLAAWADGYAGGDAFDRILHRRVLDRLRDTHPDIADRYARADEPPVVDPRWEPHRHRLAAAVTAAREQLSVVERTEVPVTWPRGDRTVAVDRGDFVGAAAPLIDRTIGACRALLEHTGVAIKDVRTVVVGGGAAGTPAMLDRLARLGPPVAEPGDDPQLTVVLGGASQPVGPAAGSTRAVRGHPRAWRPGGTCALPAAVRDLTRPVTGKVVAVTAAGPVWCDFTERPVIVRSGQPAEAGLLGLSPDRRTVVTGPIAGRLRAWNGHGDRLGLIACGAGKDEVTAAALTADGAVLVVRASGALERWRSGARRWRIPAESTARVVTWPDGGSLLGGPGGLQQIDADGTVVRRLDRRPVTALTAAPNGAVAAYADEVVLLDARTGPPKARWARRTDHPVTWVAIDPDGMTIAAAATATVHLWDSGGARAGVFTLPRPVTGLAVAGDDLFAGQAGGVAHYRRTPDVTPP
jgi:hypothetical protein